MKIPEWKQKVKYSLTAVCAALTAAVLTLATPFARFEYWLGDVLFIREKAVDNRIKIIGIDEKSLQEMGPFAGWSRQQAADLLNALDAEHSPAVIAFDINYFGSRDEAGDAALAAAAAKYDHVVMASYLDYSARLETGPDGKLKMNTMYVEQVEEPYEALAAVSRQGFTNAVQDEDNYVRRSVFSTDWNGKKNYNFAYEIYRAYQEAVGQTALLPETDEQGIYGFDYTAEPGMYEIYSYVDVMKGRLDAKVFQGSIILVGAYSSGMMDQYMVPIAKSTVMNGVEVQANHVNALLDGRIFVNLAIRICALLAGTLVGIYVLLALHKHFLVGLVSGIGLEAVIMAAAYLLYLRGIYWRCLVPVMFIALILLIRMMTGYMAERQRKQKILGVFRTYMAPQVVDELSRSRDYQIELGGQSRDIAVLFVDIRGFTSMSEGLAPDRVVEILNRYLGQVTEAIFKNEGTLDKFIGDAVMAVYNAPLNVPDYCLRAARTGLDIVKAIEGLNVTLEKDLGVRLSCGVGVHCGRAVVGNIGCSYRMDYTAIGDVVNVAERLESVAKGGQVLISSSLYEQLDGRVRVEYMGEQSLKGRQDKIKVYLLEGVNETGADRQNT